MRYHNKIRYFYCDHLLQSNNYEYTWIRSLFWGIHNSNQNTIYRNAIWRGFYFIVQSVYKSMYSYHAGASDIEKWNLRRRFTVIKCEFAFDWKTPNHFNKYTWSSVKLTMRTCMIMQTHHVQTRLNCLLMYLMVKRESYCKH